MSLLTDVQPCSHYVHAITQRNISIRVGSQYPSGHYGKELAKKGVASLSELPLFASTASSTVTRLRRTVY